MGIKLVRSDDTLLLEELAKEIWNEYYPSVIGKDYVDYILLNFQSSSSIEEDLKKGYEYYLVMEDDAVGYFSFVLREDDLYISKLYLKKDARGKGYLKVIFNYILSYAKENNRKSIVLNVNKNNKSSIAIYEYLGFKIIKDEVIDIKNGFVFDDYVMKKEI